MFFSHAELSTRLLEIFPSPVAASDREGKIFVFNAAAEQALGYTAAEALGLHAAELYQHPESAQRVLSRLRARREETSPLADPIDVVLRARDGSPVPARVTATLLLDVEGEPAGVVAVFADQRESRALQRRIDQAGAQVTAAERRTFTLSAASTLAHAMSQPLTAAMGNVEMVLMSSSGAGTERLERCFEQLERIAQIHQELTRVLVARNGDGGRG